MPIFIEAAAYAVAVVIVVAVVVSDFLAQPKGFALNCLTQFQRKKIKIIQKKNVKVLFCCSSFRPCQRLSVMMFSVQLFATKRMNVVWNQIMPYLRIDERSLALSITIVGRWN